METASFRIERTGEEKEELSEAPSVSCIDAACVKWPKQMFTGFEVQIKSYIDFNLDIGVRFL